MTRKHYILIANSLGAAMRNAETGSERWFGVYLGAKSLAEDLHATNPRFDPERFLLHVREVWAGTRTLDGKKAA
jgi:hypothetical protein